MSSRPSWIATLTLALWCNRWEAAIERQLLTPSERVAGLYAEFSLDGLLRGDMAARYQSYATGIQWGILNPNEVRALENLNARDGGDSYLTPSNMLIDGELPAQPQGSTGSRIKSMFYRNGDGRTVHFEIEN